MYVCVFRCLNMAGGDWIASGVDHLRERVVIGLASGSIWTLRQGSGGLTEVNGRD